ncbi:MAG: dipicolinate synthase subunit B [Erysipelotrichia bacterium]|nr:dipicolinate synthase subunit B [Erysipelotrichia bacterium]NCC54488.1 dipicolinate synthase subunit B [Erysipelotrichia bacterium]
MKNKKILFGVCGSFCNHAYIIDEIKKLSIFNDVQVIVSENVYQMDTRFHKAKAFIQELSDITKNDVWHTLSEAEKVGPMNIFDIYVIAPMTSNILAKLKNGIYDSPITLAAKAMLRNQRNLVIGVASNDLLGISGSNLFSLLNYKNIYSLPFYQDNPYLKPNSLISEWSLLEDTLDYAIQSLQIQPLLLQRCIE